MKNTWASKQRGFTIVELLIVIVVIAILAALSIVAYSGVQDRAKTSTAQSTATGFIKKIDLYKANAGTWPTTLSQVTGSSVSSQPHYVTGITFLTALPTASATPQSLLYVTCASGAGYQVWYWNYQTKNYAAYSGGTQDASCAVAS